MTWVLSLLIGLLVILAITAATGYFVAQEFAYMAVDRSRLAARAAANDKGAVRALGITRRTSFMLSGAQLGITVTGLLVGYVAEPLVGSAIGEALGGVGVPTAVGVATGTVLALVLSTLIQMLFGELFPKNLAIAKPEPLALGLARSTTIYLTVFGWLISIFDHSSNALLRLLKIEPVHDVEHAATSRDLEHIIADSRQSGSLSDGESLLLDRILDFPHQDVEHAMVPRTRTDSIPQTLTIAELRATMATGHSRYPVLDETGDILGVAHLQDVLTTTLPDSATVSEVMREPLLVPETLPLPDVLRALNRNAAQLACVVDEYGGFAGIVTVEDLGEELVGEIADEHDDPTSGVLAEGPVTWSIPADMRLDEVERLIQHDLPEADAETIGGLAVAEHGDFLDVGQGVRITLPLDPGLLALPDPPAPPSLQIDVLEIERHVPGRVRVRVEGTR